MPLHVERTLPSGTLSMHLTHGADRLDELLAFASRLNPKRGYLYVSKVLGKHIPVRPSVMDGIHAELADSIKTVGPCPYVIGMAETAVGLGAGVARHLAKRSGRVLFQHTTRFDIENPWIRVKEAHSHADTMHLSRVSDTLVKNLSGCEDLILVDDEISTGATLAGLAQTLLAQNLLSGVRRLYVVSIVSWLDSEKRDAFLGAIPEHVDVQFVCLLEGGFEFTPAPNWQPVLPREIETGFSQVSPERDSQHTLEIEREGLNGILMFAEEDLYSHLPKVNEPFESPVSIIGMGEYLDAPFRLALALEMRGLDVVFQSSTRSPIAIGGCIENKVTHEAPGRADLCHYLYNPCHDRQPLAFDGINHPHIARQLENNIRALNAVEEPA